MVKIIQIVFGERLITREVKNCPFELSRRASTLYMSRKGTVIQSISELSVK